jgi:hypothetical protein
MQGECYDETLVCGDARSASYNRCECRGCWWKTPLYQERVGAGILAARIEVMDMNVT